MQLENTNRSFDRFPEVRLGSKTKPGNYSTGGTIMFARNSSRLRNGDMSSIGLETMLPSGQTIDVTRGEVRSSDETSTAQTVGPGAESTALTWLRILLWSRMCAVGIP